MNQPTTYSSDYPPADHTNLSSISFLIATIIFGIPLLAIAAFFISQNLFGFLGPNQSPPQNSPVTIVNSPPPTATPIPSSSTTPTFSPSPTTSSTDQVITGVVSQISRQRQGNKALGYITINNTKIEIYPDTQIINAQNNLEDFSYIQESDRVTVYINKDRITEGSLVALRIHVNK